MSNACDCEGKTCNPHQNEGRHCWLSGFGIPEGYFTSRECLLGSKAGEKYPSCAKYPDCICGGPQLSDQPGEEHG